jgi:toxin ParE1/3/4
MRPLIWSDDAEADLEALTDYVAQDDVVAAIGNATKLSVRSSG